MAETALNFGPDWIRAYSVGDTGSNTMPTMSMPKYKLADFRYGREEMLALIPKKVKVPPCLKDFPHLVRDQFQMPMALIPITEDEQRLWTRVNSEAALRQSGKTVPGLGRTGRGGSVDRGRGRGRGGYYQRGLMHEDTDDGLHGYSRPKQVERSLSANERDPRWDDRDRRYDRSYSNRGSIPDDGFSKQEPSTRGQHNYWRKYDKDDEGDWRSSEPRSSERLGGRGSWRNSSDRDRRERDMTDRNPQNRNSNMTNRSGPSPHKNHHSWKEHQGSKLPEWSVEETNESDTLGTFDSSGAFLETKTSENTSLDEIYISDDADEGLSKDSPEASKNNFKKLPKTPPSSSSKGSVKKRANSSPRDENTVKDQTAQILSEQSNSSNSKSEITKSISGVINANADSSSKLLKVTKKLEFSSNTHRTVPCVNTKNTKVEESVMSSNVRNSANATPTSSAAEEDAFAHHKKATENMVAQWTEEEEQQAVSQSSEIHSPQELETKWFYRDPQGDIQGPFTSAEMLEWFTAGYFTMNLQLRRTYDETFSELGDLIKAWGGVPFILKNLPPPIRHMPALASQLTAPLPQTNVPNPSTVPPASNQIPKQEELLALQRQLYQQQLMQQQLILRQQAQMQALLSQLKQQDNFSSLSSQQQQQVLTQHIMAQQQMPRPSLSQMPEQPSLLDPLSLPLPLLGLSAQPVVNDMSLWKSASSSSWPANLGSSQPPGTSIWDVDVTKSLSDESEKQKKLAEEQDKLRKAEELRLEQEREEELKRQQEARLLQELQKQEEEKRRIEELKRQEELRRLEEKMRQEEEERKRQEELRKQEELKRQEELRKQEELKRQEELRKQEELKRLEELRKQEEQRLLEERRKEEMLRQEEIRKMQEKKQEEKRKKEEEKKKQQEKEQEKLLELERQKEVLRLKEMEREEKYQAEKREREAFELAKLAELKLRSQGPVWGIQNAQPEVQMSLIAIQKIEEEREREEREEKMRQQALQQQTVKQVQQNKNGLSWAKRATENQPAVKSLFEIQQEEAEQLVFSQRIQKPQPPPPTLSPSAGVWGNTSHLNKITAAPQTWSTSNIPSSTAGFWDDVISNNTQMKKQPQKNNETSAFPALRNRTPPTSTVTSNKNKNVRAKKEEDAVTRLFGSHHKPTDEFTKWCTDAISSMPSSVDVPTFVAFLKDIESPYEVYDYVKSYLGEGKEPREFAKQFLERRSKFRNQSKQAPAEENTLWGPAPAITPIVNKPSVQSSIDCDGNSNAKGKAKKRKNRMQKLDNSMLGFTVQPNPDRLNVGELDHFEGQ